MPANVVVAFEPNPGPQTAFLASTAREVMYGGAAGGGKSHAIIALPFYRIHNPKHRSILFRRTRPQLQEVIDRQQDLYPLIDPGCKWQEDKSRWVWSSGAITQMGYMEHEQDRFKFKTFEYDLIAFDELTSFTEKMYLFMFSRNRSKDIALPAIMRSGTNPGDVGHQWVFDRFIANRESYRVYARNQETEVEGMGKVMITTTQQFIPAKLADNPKMADRPSYIAGLKEMGDDGEAYLAGDWRAFSGQMFRKPLIVVQPKGWTPGCIIVRATDYGWADPLCTLWLRAHRNGDVEVVREMYSPNLTIDMIASRTKEIETEMKLKPSISVAGKDMFNTQGTSAQSVATMLAAKGLWYTEANTDVIAGWTRVNTLLHNGRILVDEGMAPNLIRTLGNLVRDPNKPTHLKDRQEDHPADTLRYGVLAIFDAIDVKPEAQQEVTEHDPFFRKLQESIQREQGGQVLFPGLE